MTTKNTIGIHFIDLDTRERAIFDRVISFNVTHGLKASITENSADADLIILSDTEFSQAEQYADEKTIIVLSNDDNADGDFQIKRPLLITKVMNTLGEAVEMAKTKGPAASAPSETNDTGLVDVNIENAATDTEVAETPAQAVVVEAPAEEEPEQQAHHALVIDDSAAIRKQLELELRDAGITSDFADCGEAALEKIKEGHYDLIFLDIIMPGIDGYETCKQMRATAEYKKTPIIMLSGKTSPLDEVQGVIAGATTYLTKPVKSDKLQETLNRVTKWINNYAVKKDATV